MIKMKTLTIGGVTYEVGNQDSEGSGVHIGPEAPTDENVSIWIDTDEESEGA